MTTSSEKMMTALGYTVGSRFNRICNFGPILIWTNFCNE